MTVSLDLAITAIRANRRDEARQLLNLLIQQNPNDELAWLWMSELVDSDERRARCLYHVLAINPDSPVARQGLQRLGIVLTDSRPVKPPTKTKAVSPAKPASPTNKPKRRPNHDPKAITQELPFTPLRDPFAEEESAEDQPAANDETATRKKLSDTKQRLRILSQALETDDESSDQPTETDEPDSEAVAPVVPPFQPPPPATEETPAESATVAPPLKKPKSKSKSQSKAKADTKPNGNVAATSTNKETDKETEPSPEATEQPETPPEKASTTDDATESQASSVPLPDFEQALSQINKNPLPNGFATGSVPITQPFLSPEGSPHKSIHSLSSDSRPMSGAGYVSPSNPTRPMPSGYQASPMANQQPYVGQMYVQLTRPSQPVSMPPTLGMPVQHPGVYHSEPIPVVHANTTMGMPQVSPPHYSPLHHSNTTMGMPIPNGSANSAHFAAGANLLAPQADIMPRNNSQAVPGRSTQSDRELIAAWQNEHHKSMASTEDDDEDEEVNILAIFVFGFLAITALGGFGVLTLLMITGY